MVTPVAAGNRQLRLRSRPVGSPGDETWELTREPVPEPGEGEFLVRTLYISVDPAMRSWLNEGESYVPPVELGAVMRAAGIGEVVRSRHPGFPVGGYVAGRFGVQEYACGDGTGVRVVDPDVASLPTYLGALGLAGMTAYFGLFDIGRPSPGETVVVSGAAGGVGGLVGQLARIHGCRVVGIAGGPRKCERVVGELGFDACVDHRGSDVAAELATLCPDGIHVFFDNVGGSVLDAGLANLAHGARIVLCGAVSQYNERVPVGPANYLSLLVKRASMTGFVVFDYERRFPEAAAEVGRHLREGTLRTEEHIVDGIENFPDALRGLFVGANTGKLVLRVAEPGRTS